VHFDEDLVLGDLGNFYLADSEGAGGSLTNGKVAAGIDDG